MDDIAQARTQQELIIEAKKRLSPAAWDYLCGGGESETTLKRNRYAIDSIAFRPRVLIDVTDPDPATVFMGQNLRMPVICAPIGSLHLMDPGGNIPVVRAMDKFGSIPVISIMTNPRLEDCAAETDGYKIFQLYVRGDMDWVDKTLDRVVAAGFGALTITVDVAHYGRRERDMYNRFNRRAFAQRSNLEGIDLTEEWRWRGALTWDFVDHCKSHCGLPVLVKGIATAEDAQMAVDRGIDVILVSNHGGRQLDHGAGSIAPLAEGAAVGGSGAGGGAGLGLTTAGYFAWQGVQAGFKLVHIWNDARHLVIKIGCRVAPADSEDRDIAPVLTADASFASKILPYRKG